MVFLSALFDYMGAIIAAVFIVVTGIILLGSKFYFEHKKEIQKRAKNNFNKTKDSLKQHSNYFGNFFKKNKIRQLFLMMLFSKMMKPQRLYLKK